MKRLFKVIGWSFLWLIFFWSFLVISFPAKTAKGWLTDRLEKGLNARVSIEELNMRWDLDLRLKGISIEGQEPEAGSQEASVFSVKLTSLDVEPRLLSLIRLKPEIDFTGSPSSGGNFTGSYDQEVLSLSFKNVLFKDFTIASLPVPSVALFSGSGRLKLVKGKGMIEVEINGIPGGKQRTTAPGGEGPGLDGKLKVTVSIPGLNLPQ